MLTDTGVVSGSYTTRDILFDLSPRLWLGKDLYGNDVPTDSVLQAIATFMKNNPTVTIEIGVHTDTRGGDRACMVISQKRAKAVVEHLHDLGVPLKRMMPMGYGESEPLVTDQQIAAAATDAEKEALHQLNRRVVLLILRS
ncbi:MAG: OmpA family protein [Salibacteraceae bacterium]